MLRKRIWRQLALLMITGFAALFSGILSVSAADDSATTVKPNRGVLVGQVLMTPTRPVERIGVSAPQAPVSGATITISNLSSHRRTVVTTDKQGKFRVELRSGTYRMDIQSKGRYPRPKNLPANVAIRKGEETHFDIQMDSGMR
jgi:hypothetical protein